MMSRPHETRGLLDPLHQHSSRDEISAAIHPTVDPVTVDICVQSNVSKFEKLMFIAKHKASSHIQLSGVLKESIFSNMELARHRLIYWNA